MCDSTYSTVSDALRVGSAACQCATCDHLFNGVAAFDKHRVLTNKERAKRRCLSVTEMREAGMAVNNRGLWVTEPRGDVIYSAS